MVLNLMLDDQLNSDESYEEEVTIIDEYAEKLLKAKVIIEVALEQNVNDNRSVNDDTQSSVHSVNQKRYKLPKIQLQKFSGKIIDWLSWWALFKKIDLDEELSAADKFQYLLQSVEESSRA